MARLKDIELAPFRWKGTRHRLFLTHDDVFKSPVDTYRYMIAPSRAELEKKIADYVETARFDGLYESLFLPIMRIDTSPSNGFGLSRYWATENRHWVTVNPQIGDNEKHQYVCGWDTPPEQRLKTATRSTSALPTTIDQLPFIDTAERDWVYYALFKEYVWRAFTRLNENLKHRFTINKGAILDELVEGHYSSSQSRMENQLYEDYVWRPFLQK